MQRQTAPNRSGPLVRAGVVLGLSFGGFFDGIVFHQVLQWHHMLTGVADAAVRDDIALNTLADGLFHAATYVLGLIGLVMLWRARVELVGPRSGRVLAGAMLAGAGLFNLVEGLVNHQLLDIHHLRTDVADPLPWDMAFLASGVLLMAVGWWLVRAATSAATAER